MEKKSIVRNLDASGRIVIPYELRKLLGFENQCEVEISGNWECITVSKYRKKCVLCGGEIEKGDSKVCKRCIRSMEFDTGEDYE